MKTDKVSKANLDKLRECYEIVKQDRYRLNGKGNIKTLARKYDAVIDAFNDCLSELFGLGDYDKDTTEQRALRSSKRWFFHQFATCVIHIKWDVSDENDMILLDQVYLAQVHQFLDNPKKWNRFIAQCGKEDIPIGFLWDERLESFDVEDEYLEKYIPITESDFQKWEKGCKGEEWIERWRKEIDRLKERLRVYKRKEF